MEPPAEPPLTSEEQAASNLKRPHEEDAPSLPNKKGKTGAAMAEAHLSDTMLSVPSYIVT